MDKGKSRKFEEGAVGITGKGIRSVDWGDVLEEKGKLVS